MNKNNNISKIVFKNNPFKHSNKEYYNLFYYKNNKLLSVEKMSLKDIIKYLNKGLKISLSENIFLNDYFLKNIIIKNKVLYL